MTFLVGMVYVLNGRLLYAWDILNYLEYAELLGYPRLLRIAGPRVEPRLSGLFTMHNSQCQNEEDRLASIPYLSLKLALFLLPTITPSYAVGVCGCMALVVLVEAIAILGSWSCCAKGRCRWRRMGEAYHSIRPFRESLVIRSDGGRPCESHARKSRNEDQTEGTRAMLNGSRCCWRPKQRRQSRACKP